MQYFQLNEFTKSVTATRCGIDNSIKDAQVVDNIHNLVHNVLDPARFLLGMPIYVTSGYRCMLLNEMVGGVDDSQHCLGYAADITCNDNNKLVSILLNLLSFDQIIIYRNRGRIRFIHVSYVSLQKNRREVIWRK